MEGKHTKLPMTECGGSVYVETFGGSENIAIFFSVREGNIGGDYEAMEREAKANARMFMAGNEMLEALRYARRFLNKQDHDTDFVDAAIQKALGYDLVKREEKHHE